MVPNRATHHIYPKRFKIILVSHSYEYSKDNKNHIKQIVSLNLAEDVTPKLNKRIKIYDDFSDFLSN